ncbi:hypothetical protein QA612_18595 [Evansella sp. AB-P1]|nr:hypothetical protein [Evansella sp. AB-P1]MDG5789471.1 hypothetical protein [Evansella sp. AB-P1]
MRNTNYDDFESISRKWLWKLKSSNILEYGQGTATENEDILLNHNK